MSNHLYLLYKHAMMTNILKGEAGVTNEHLQLFLAKVYSTYFLTGAFLSFSMLGESSGSKRIRQWTIN